MALTSTAFKLAVVVSAVDRLSGPLKKMAAQTEQTRSGLLRLGKAGEALTKIGGTATLAGGAVVGALTPAINKFADWQKGMTEVHTLLGAQFQGMEKLSQGALSVLRRYPLVAGETTKALYDLISASVPAGKSLMALELSAKAAQAGVTDISTTADVGTSVLNSYGWQVERLEDVFDMLFLAVRKGKTTMGELGQFIGNLTPIAAAADVKFHQLASAIAVMTSKGIKTDIATTALKNLINVIAKEPETIREVAGELAFRAAKRGDLLGVLTEIAAKNTDFAKMTQIFPDIRAGLAATALAADVDKWRQWSEETKNARGEMGKAAELMQSILSVRFAILRNRIEAVAITIGKGAAPEIEKLIEKFGGLLGSVEKNDKGLQNLGATLVKVAKWLIPIGGGLLTVGIAFQTIAFAGAGFLKFFAIFKSLPVVINVLIPVLQTLQWLIGGTLTILGTSGVIIVAGITAGFYDLFLVISNWRQLMSTTKSELVGWFDDVFGPIGDAVLFAQDFWLKAGGGWIDALKKGISDKWTGLRNLIFNKLDFFNKMLPGSDAEIGPLSKLTAAGRAIPQTMAAGVAAAMPALSRQIDRLAANTAMNLGIGSPTAAIASPSGISAPAPAVFAPAAAGRASNTVHVENINIFETTDASRTGEEVRKSLADLIAELASQS